MKSSQNKVKSSRTHYTRKRIEKLQLLDHENKKYNRSAESFINKKKNLYPVLIVENLPPTFGNIDKSNRRKASKFSKEEEYLLNLIARITAEIFIKEEL